MSGAGPAPAPLYRHTQVGRFTLALDLVLLLLIGIPAVRSGAPSLWVGVGIVLLIGVLFGTLTVEVRADALRLWFGPGLVRRTVPLANVAGAEVSSAPWWNGIGLRFTPTGIMYNVAVGATVDLVHHSGKRVRVGTDEPEALRLAVERALSQRTASGSGARA